MKRSISGVFLILFSLSALAGNDCAVIGFHEPGTHTYDGPTWCEKVSFKDIVVRGPLQVDGSNISGLTDVSGPVTSAGSTLDSIQIENNFSSEKVKLNSNSVVKGNIVFLGPKGTVILDKTSHVSGKIINGTEKQD